MPFQIRAFVTARPSRHSTPVAGSAAPRSTPTAWAATRARAARSPPAWPATPGFDPLTHAFAGEDGLGRPYATYNVKSLYGGARYLMVNTTGVHGGGIVRSVLRGREPVARLDGFGYCDPNALGARPVARWSYVRAPGTRLGGWIADGCDAP